MSRNAEAVRRDIERARMELGQTLEAIGDRVAPKKVVARTKESVHEKVEDVKETVKEKTSPSRLARRPVEAVKRGAHAVMGTAEETKEELVTKVSSAKDSVADRAQQAQGNPLAAGILAFAAGFFAASLLKSNEREQRLAERAQGLLEPVKQEAVERGRVVAKGVQEHAKERFQTVAEKAQEAADQVKEEAAGAARSLKAGASAQAEEVKDDARRATSRVKRTAEVQRSTASRRPATNGSRSGPTVRRVVTTKGRAG